VVNLILIARAADIIPRVADEAIKAEVINLIGLNLGVTIRDKLCPDDSYKLSQT